MSLAPVALFCYNRLDTLKETLTALQANKFSLESDLFIFSDGAKSEADKVKVEKVREYIKTVSGFKSVTVREAEKNRGLANSIISGVTEIVEKYGKIIVLEDDIVTAPFFLEWMNSALDLYENNDKVAGIHAWSPPQEFGERPDTYFIREVGCWGWATWKRGWDLFEPDGSKLLKEFKSRKVIYDFNVKNTYPYYEMLRNQKEGWIDSWAVRWYASVFLKGRFGLQPGRALVRNIGYQSGTHCNFDETFQDDVIAGEPPQLKKQEIRFDDTTLTSVYMNYNKSVYRSRLLDRCLPLELKILLRKIKKFFI